jgi:hypothetical protein
MVARNLNYLLLHYLSFPPQNPTYLSTCWLLFSLLSFSFLPCFLKFQHYGGEEAKACGNDGLVLVFYMIMQHVMNMQALILQGEWTNVVIFSICLQSLGFRDRTIWNFERQFGFVDWYLLGSFTEKMFNP